MNYFVNDERSLHRVNRRDGISKDDSSMIQIPTLALEDFYKGVRKGLCRTNTPSLIICV